MTAHSFSNFALFAVSAVSSAAKALTLNINDATKMNANLIVSSPLQAKG
jgi:hypothetical protein